MVTIMESVMLKLNLRPMLRLTQPFFTAPMAMVLDTMAMLVWDIMAMLALVIMDMLDLVITDTLVLGILAMLTTMASVRPRPSPRLRLSLPFFTAPMAMVLATMAMLVLDILDTLPTMASVQHD